MKKLINICVDIFAKLFTLICVHEADLSDEHVKKNIMTCLAAAHAAIVAMCIKMGYTTEDLHSMAKKGLEGTENK